MKFKLILMSSMAIISLIIASQSYAEKNKPKPSPSLPQIIGIDSIDRIPDSYIITYKDDVINSTYIQLNKSSELNSISMEDVNVTFSQSIATSSNSQLTAIYGNTVNGAAITNSDENSVRNLYNDSRVDKIYANFNLYESSYNDSPQIQAPWGLDRIDQSNYPLDSKYHFSNTAPDIHVFVLDSGIDENHPEFNGRNIDEHIFSQTPCFTPLCSIQYMITGASDLRGHGTHVAGIIAGQTYGVAKDVQLHSYRIFDVNGVTTLAVIIDALDTLYRDISSHNLLPAVVNMSFGTDLSGLFNPNLVLPYIEVLQNLKLSLGVHMVAAAGNNFSENCTSPASSAAVISVGASNMVNNQDQRPSFSNYGSCVDIYAPGVDIDSALFNTSLSTTMQGTSQATPFVAGALALYLQDPSHRDDSPNQAKAALLSSATSVNFPNTTNGPQKLLNTIAFSPLPNQPDQYDDIAIRGYTDDYEGDAESLLENIPQTHNFHDAGDEDWTMVWIPENSSFEFKTNMIGINSSTNFDIYKVTDIDLNTEYPNSGRFIINSMQLVASGTNNTPKIISADGGFLYVMKVVSSNNSYGNDTDYSVSLTSPLPITADQYDNIGIRGYVDDVDGDAESLLENIPQTHNFHDAGDEDWTMVWIPTNLTFNVSVNKIGHNSDAKISVYKVTDIILNPDHPNTNRFIINAKTLVGSDNSPGNLSVDVNADGGFLYVMKVESNINSSGYGTEYEIILQ